MPRLAAPARAVAVVLAAAACTRQPEPPPRPPGGLITPREVAVHDSYVWSIARKLRGYRYRADLPQKEGVTVVQMLIARDGRLLDVWVIRSSGQPEMDKSVLIAARQSAPYAPLQPEIPETTATFKLQLISTPE
jgi:TonB family protein